MSPSRTCSSMSHLLGMEQPGPRRGRGFEEGSWRGGKSGRHESRMPTSRYHTAGGWRASGFNYRADPPPPVTTHNNNNKIPRVRRAEDVCGLACLFPISDSGGGPLATRRWAGNKQHAANSKQQIGQRGQRQRQGRRLRRRTAKEQGGPCW
jgi:hypothetical protein